MNDNTVAQGLFSSVVKSALTAGRLDVYGEWLRTLFQGMIFLMVSIATIIGSLFIPENSYTTIAIVSFIHIFAWVFGWGATEKFLISGPRLRRQYLHLLRLSNASFVFFPYPDYNWFEQKVNPSYEFIGSSSSLSKPVIKRVTDANLKEAVYIQNKIFPDVYNGSADIEASVGQAHSWMDKLEYYLAYLDGMPIGITGVYSYKDYPKDAWMGWFGVLPEFRCKGIGSCLFDITVAKAKEMGFENFRVYTDEIALDDESKFYDNKGMLCERYDNSKDVYTRISQTLVYSLSLEKGKKPAKWDSKYLYLKEHDEANKKR
jgi:GNAT superfamily N-acetyltransferase